MTERSLATALDHRVFGMHSSASSVDGGGLRHYSSSMRWLAVIAGLLVILCGCATTNTADADKAAQPYTCIPPARPAAPPLAAEAPERIAVIGDSLTNGSPQGGTGNKRWTAVVQNDLRARGLNAVVNFGAEGASGYVSHGNRGGIFEGKISTTVKPDDRIVVFFGSRNDSKASAADLARATCDAFREAEIAAPRAQLLVIGPMGEFPQTPESLVRASEIIKNRAHELGARFIDPMADGWFVDRQDLIGADGVHPTDDGHAYMAERIAPVIEQMLNAPTPGTP
jgi:lysophospholipase L1-like esterase